MQYRTIKDLSNTIRHNLWKIPRDIDLVVGIPRSGMLPASMIALYLNTKFTDLDSFINGHIYNTGWTRTSFIPSTHSHKILIVDDSVCSGKSIEQAKEELSACDGFDFFFFAAYVRSEAAAKVDIYCEIIDDNRVFEWNLFHHIQLSHTCMDIDGVLCCDPDNDDDGQEYLKFLETAKPLFIPTAPINTLISCRLEKYRSQTEAWLDKYNIKYNNLIMLDFPDKVSRLKWGKHGEYKGEYYKNSDDSLFIESSYKQALTIAKLSRKPVICVETNELLLNNIERMKGLFRNKLPRIYNITKFFWQKISHKNNN